MNVENLDLYDKSALIDRLTTGVQRQRRPVVFLVGSPLTAPQADSLGGVPGVDGVVQLIREEFPDHAQQLDFDGALKEASNRYQAAFTYLLGRRGQQAANEVIKRAVWRARKPLDGTKSYLPSASTSDDACRALDTDHDGWVLPPAAEALGRIVTFYPDYFGRAVLTTNFDPLIEVAIGKLGGSYFRTVLHGDGNLGQTEGSGCHIIHLHGYWYGADTLHTPRQLMQPRPRLKASLSSLVREKTLVVCGYGGWNDTFTEALMSLVLDDSAYPDIIWCLRSGLESLNKELLVKMAPGIARGHISLYGGIDCQEFLPELESRWRQQVVAQVPAVPNPDSSRLRFYVGVAEQIDRQPEVEHQLVGRLLGDKADNPPLTDFCVGRDGELRDLATSTQKVCFITGFGGQGKSTVAARFYSHAQQHGMYDLYIWRDCKEESERFEGQIISIIEALSSGRVSGKELAQQSMESLASLFALQANGKRILLVFDNVDHYVDLEKGTLSGNAEEFLRAFVLHVSNCRLVFTCRPQLLYPGLDVLVQKIEGLDFSAAEQLFAKRKATATAAELSYAHSVTGGHAFWLDLIAAQVAKDPAVSRLEAIVDRIRAGGGELPTATLSSIWQTLQERQKLVLRAMAETVRPETDEQVAKYLRGRLTFQQVMKALRSLRSLNLIVLKPRDGSADVFELHPLVREFVRRTFPMKDRLGFLESIINVYLKFIGANKAQAAGHRSFSQLHHWTENAELCIAAGKYDRAFDCLADVGAAFSESDTPGEFARVAGELFRSIDWSKHQTYKYFDAVFSEFVQILVRLGRVSESEDMLQRYEATVPTKDARYINYCSLRCYAYWVRGEHPNAIKWGQRGAELKERSNIDTRYDSSHFLALARRDSGQIDSALEYFLGAVPLEKVIDPEEFDDDRPGPFYGNIGRCLHLMGQIDPAIICYRKSAVMLQRDGDRHVENQGFIRKWIGELLLGKGDYCLAKTFLEAARAKWMIVCPTRLAEIDQQLVDIREHTANCREMTSKNLERYCVAWIYGRESDFVSI